MVLLRTRTVLGGTRFFIFKNYFVFNLECVLEKKMFYIFSFRDRLKLIGLVPPGGSINFVIFLTLFETK